MTEAYDDIIPLPHPTSPKHPRMSAADRAAQFSPFAALAGHETAIRETARLTDRRAELDEDVKAELDRRLRILAQRQTEHPEAVIRYFQADEKKTGGSYQTVAGAIKKIDAARRAVVMMDGERIPIDDIYEIESAHLLPLL